MEKNNFRELDKLFRSKLGAESALDQDWNTPSDHVFDQAMNSLPKKENRKRPLFFWFMSGLALSLLGLLFLANNNRIDQLEDKITLLSQDHLQKELHTDSADKASSITAVSSVKSIRPNPVQKRNSSSEFNNSTTAGSITEKKLSQKLNSTFAPSASDQKVKATAREHTPSLDAQKGTVYPNHPALEFSLSDLNQENIINNSTQRKLRSHELLLLLGFKHLSVDQEYIDGPNVMISAEPLTPPKRAFYIFVGTNWSSFRMMNVLENPYSLNQYDQNRIGYQLGMGVDWRLTKRVGVSYRLTFERMHNRSLYQSDMTFDIENIIEDAAGNSIYLSALVLESPLGQIIEELRMNLDGMTMTNGDMMNNTTNIFQQFGLATIDVSPYYEIIRRGRWSGLLHAGVSASYILDYDQKMDMQLSYSDDMLMQTSYSKTDMNQVSRALFGISADAEIRYSWTKRLSTSLLAGTTRSLNSVRKNKTVGDPTKTYLDRWYLNSTILYEF